MGLRACATSRTKVFRITRLFLGYFWLLSPTAKTPPAHHGHWGKIRQKTRFPQGNAFSGSQNQNLAPTPLFPKPQFWT